METTGPFELPTSIAEPYANYRRSRQLDPVIKYKFLRYTCSALIKHLSITLIALARDVDRKLYGQAVLKVFSSSGLGGWIDAVGLIWSQRKQMTGKAQDYLRVICEAGQGAGVDLSDAENHLRKIYERLSRKGYRISTIKVFSALRILRSFVEIRNKCAHGALDVMFYSEVEADYYALLKCLFAVLPFHAFTFFGKRGSYVYKLTGVQPEAVSKVARGNLWIESELLKSSASSDPPLAFYNSESEEFFFLNDAVHLPPRGLGNHSP